MTKFKLFTLLFFTLFYLQSQAQSLSIVASTWPPYADETLPDSGLAIKIVKAAFKQSGYDSTVRIEQWEKALAGSKIGAYDVVGAIWKTKERQETLLYSNHYLKNNIVFIARASSQFEFTSLNELHGLLIGVLKDYEYDEKFMNDPKILKFQAKRLTQNLIAVQDGNLDAAVADKRLAQYELKHFMRNNIDKFRFLAKPLSSRKLYIAAPLKNPESQTIITKFNQGLATIKENGTYQKILDYYTF